MAQLPAHLAELAPERIASLLRTQRYGRSYSLLATTGSTNDDARRAALAGAEAGHVIVADHQTAGRGSHGRVWSSPAGVDLYVSIVDSVRRPLAELPPLTLAVGLGVAEAIEVALRTGADPTSGTAAVKWPNDVWLAGQKCAGILVEVSSTGSVTSADSDVQSLVLGVGLNINRQVFPDDLEHPATSLLQQSGQCHDRGLVLAELLARIEHQVRRFETFGPGPAIADLDPRLTFRGELVACGEVRGTLLGVTPDGSLRLATADGERHVVAGRLRRL